jgi:hypothetical protein
VGHLLPPNYCRIRRPGKTHRPPDTPQSQLSPGPRRQFDKDRPLLCQRSSPSRTRTQVPPEVQHRGAPSLSRTTQPLLAEVPVRIYTCIYTTIMCLPATSPSSSVSANAAPTAAASQYSPTWPGVARSWRGIRCCWCNGSHFDSLQQLGAL